MDLGLKDRLALVLGSSSGIGLGIAEALLAEGARVAMVSRSAERLEAAVTEIGAEAALGSGRIALLVADTSNSAQMRGLASEATGALGGPVEILVTNSGGPPRGGALDAPASDWEATYRSLVLAPRILSEAVLPEMRRGGFGRIVNVGSSSTIEPIPGLALSSVHRMAAVGFFATLAREVAADGVTVNTIATGRFATDRIAEAYGSLAAAERVAREEIPAGRLGTPREYGDLVAFICSERASYLTGAVIPLDGGMLRSV